MPKFGGNVDWGESHLEKNEITLILCFQTFSILKTLLKLNNTCYGSAPLFGLVTRIKVSSIIQITFLVLKSMKYKA